MILHSLIVMTYNCFQSKIKIRTEDQELGKDRFHLVLTLCRTMASEREHGILLL